MPGNVTFPSLPTCSPGELLGKRGNLKYPQSDFRGCCSVEGQPLAPFQEGTGGLHSYFFCAWLGGEESGMDELLSMVLVNTPLGREGHLKCLL